jgi:hypothetical protein
METSDHANTPLEPTPVEGPSKVDAPAAGLPSLPSRLWLWALAAGLAAGLGAGLGGEALFGRFKPVIVHPANWDQLSAFDKPDVDSALLRKATPGVEVKNAAATYGLLGVLLGGALGLVAGLARGSARSALVATLVGAVAGTAAGAGMSAAMIPIFFRTVDAETGMLLGLLTHAGIWVPIGAAAGLAFGIGLGGPRSIALALLGGLAGAALGTMAYEVINGLVFPNARLDKPIPDESQSRILGAFCVTIFTAAGAALGVGERKPVDRKPKEASHPLNA